MGWRRDQRKNKKRRNFEFWHHVMLKTVNIKHFSHNLSINLFYCRCYFSKGQKQKLNRMQEAWSCMFCFSRLKMKWLEPNRPNLLKLFFAFSWHNESRRNMLKSHFQIFTRKLKGRDTIGATFYLLLPYSVDYRRISTWGYLRCRASTTTRVNCQDQVNVLKSKIPAKLLCYMI